MEMKRIGPSPSVRLETGAAILAGAQVHSIQAVKPRFTAFTRAHRRYLDAQRKVETAETRLRTGQARLAACDAEQDAAVEALARGLITDGQSRVNPFAAFGAAAPSQVKQLSPAVEAKAIHQLVVAVQRNNTVSKTTLQAAQAAEKAAQTLEAALVSLDRLQQKLRVTRHDRDAIGPVWDTALAALKRGARAAADNGAPGLYTALFGRLRRSKTKKVQPAPTPPVPPAANAA